MKYDKHILLISSLIMLCLISMNANAQKFTLQNTNVQGFTINSRNTNSINIKHNISDFEIKDNEIIFEGIQLQSEAGTPNLPNNSCFILIPNNSRPTVEIISSKEKIIENVEIRPAEKITADNDKNIISNNYAEVYNEDAFYPHKICQISDNYNIRAFNFILLNVAPFQYNPVRKSLKITYDIELKISYNDNANYLYDNRLRSKEWDNLLKDIVLNPETISDFNYDYYLKEIIENDKEGCEYLIITPDNQDIKKWADSLAIFRNEQGILTKVININEIEENKPLVIKDYFHNIYQNWDLVPSSILLFGDYSMDNTKGISSFFLNDHPETNLKYLTDNKLVDFNNDNLPEINIARLPVANEEEAELMTRKIFRYEREPSDNQDYYSKPITAMGFQESRWFQLCSEVIAGFFAQKGRTPERINAIYEGIPDSVWSTAANTEKIIDYFGPEGLDYIPSDLKHLHDWNSDSYKLTEAINNGSFMVQHRDHGRYQNWGEPFLSNVEINTLENEDLCFIMSANCQTGHFNYGWGSGNDCFAERFLRVKNGAIAVVAASETSYSFVNDTYVWGYYDYLWNEFMPSFGDNNTIFKYPSFANVYGKYFLKQSSWPYLNDYKDITYKLFHYFGDAYLQLNTQMPEHIEISHPNSINSACSHIMIKKDNDTRLALSVDGKIIATSLGSDSMISFKPQIAGKKIKVVATKQDHYRYEGYIDVVSYLNNDELKVYPNPTRSKIFIESRNIKSVVMYNTLGQILYQYDNNSILPSEKIIIDCEDIKERLLHLHIIYDDGRVKTIKTMKL